MLAESSPKSQSQFVMVPILASAKVTSSGDRPKVLSALKSAWGMTGVENTFTKIGSGLDIEPQLSFTQSLAVYVPAVK